jgi:hypothetical protein
MQNLKPCPYRQVDDEGQILCDKIKSGDRQVSPNICRACPVSAINCSHLRATLDHHARPPITVRYGNGKTEVWDDTAPSISLARAACAVKVTPIHSPRDCAGCPIRQPLVTAESINVIPPHPVPAPMPLSRRPAATRLPRVATAPVAAITYAAPPAVPVAPSPVAAEARSNIVAQKIIQLQEWLAGHKSPSEPADESERVMPIAVGARPARVLAEEKRVGWTD